MDFSERNKIKNTCSQLKVSEVEVISSYKKGYIGKNVFKVTLNDGSKRYVEQILKNGNKGDAVVIIPITSCGKFIMIIESRPNTESGVLLEFPAGMVDEGESSLESAKRELLEETGYVSDNFYELEWHYQDQGCSGAVVRTYVAEDCRKVGEKKLDEFEKLEVLEASYNDILRVIDHEDEDLEMSDANSKIAFYEYTRKIKNRL